MRGSGAVRAHQPPVFQCAPTSPAVGLTPRPSRRMRSTSVPGNARLRESRRREAEQDTPHQRADRTQVVRKRGFALPHNHLPRLPRHVELQDFVPTRRRLVSAGRAVSELGFSSAARAESLECDVLHSVQPGPFQPAGDEFAGREHDLGVANQRASRVDSCSPAR